MDSPRYDIYLTGKLAEGVAPAAASAQLAALFKSTPEAMAALLTGKPQLLKRGVDKATALKYRDALQRIGVLVAFKAQPAAPSQPTATPTTTPAPASPATPAAAAITLAPAGGDLLSEAERSRPPLVALDTSAYQLAPLAAAQPAPTPLVAAPDTSHLSLTAAGSDVLTDAERERPPAMAPNVSDFSLAPVGTDLAEAAPPAGSAPDTSHLSLAPADAGPLAGVRLPLPAAPNTDHLQLAD